MPDFLPITGYRKNRDPVFNAWVTMRQRCQNPNAHAYERYGGRGIKVCVRWWTFANFIADMGPRPDGCSIERIDNDGDYEPTNCKWIPLGEQNKNKRPRKSAALNGNEQGADANAHRTGSLSTTVEEHFHTHHAGHPPAATTCHKGPVDKTNTQGDAMTRVRIIGGYLNIGRRGGGGGRPTDPDYGVDEGDIDDGGEYPDQGLPGGWGGQRPIDPGFGRPGRPGRPEGGGDRPSQGLPGGPIRPINPGSPDNSLPPGTIVPPLPPDLDLDFEGKAYLSVNLIYQGQRHHHHIIVTIPPASPEHPIAGQPPGTAQPKRT